LAACEGLDLYQGSTIFGNMGFDEARTPRLGQIYRQNTTKT